MSLRVVPAMVLVALLGLGGFAVAQDGSGSPSNHGGSGSDHNTTASNTTTSHETGTSAPPSSAPPPNCDQQPAGPQREECLKAARCRNNPSAQGCPASSTRRPDPRRTTDRLEFIQFTVQAPKRIVDFKVEGKQTLDSLVLDTGSNAAFMAERKDGVLVVGNADNRLRLHDNPVGQIEFKGVDGSVILTFPAGTRIQAAPHVARLLYSDGRTALLLADNATWNGLSVTLTGFFGFHVNKADGPFAEAVATGALRAELQAAVESRHLGAEVALQANPANASRAIQVVAYDDVAVQVKLAGGGAPIAVTLSSNLTQGRTVVLHVDPALLRNSTADRLVLHYYDNHADGTQTEVVFAKASSLADVLDPSKGGGPKYWVVSDADGLQVLVSVPHWSTHTITLAGLGAVLQPNVVMGLAAGVVGSLVAATAMFWPRKAR